MSTIKILDEIIHTLRVIFDIINYSPSPKLMKNQKRDAHRPKSKAPSEGSYYSSSQNPIARKPQASYVSMFANGIVNPISKTPSFPRTIIVQPRRSMKLFRSQSIPSFHRSDSVLQSYRQKATLALSSSSTLAAYSNQNTAQTAVALTTYSLLLEATAS